MANSTHFTNSALCTAGKLAANGLPLLRHKGKSYGPDIEPCAPVSCTWASEESHLASDHFRRPTVSSGQTQILPLSVLYS